MSSTGSESRQFYKRKRPTIVAGRIPELGFFPQVILPMASAKGNWVRVSSSSPCPICHTTDWCGMTADGALAGCMRIEEGCFRIKEGRDGSRVYLHRLANGPRPEADLPPRAGPEAERADPDTLNAVYS